MVVMTETALISPGEYAQRYGISPQTVRRYIRLGYLPAVQVGPRLWRIDSHAPLPDFPNGQRGPHPVRGRIRNAA